MYLLDFGSERKRMTNKEISPKSKVAIFGFVLGVLTVIVILFAKRC